MMSLTMKNLSILLLSWFTLLEISSSAPILQSHVVSRDDKTTLPIPDYDDSLMEAYNNEENFDKYHYDDKDFPYKKYDYSLCELHYNQRPWYCSALKNSTLENSSMSLNSSPYIGNTYRSTPETSSNSFPVVFMIFLLSYIFFSFLWSIYACHGAHKIHDYLNFKIEQSNYTRFEENLMNLLIFALYFIVYVPILPYVFSSIIGEIFS